MECSRVDITEMQCWVFRLAQKKWNITPQECTDIFRKYEIFGFIEDCYDTLHLSGYSTVLDDIEMILDSNGVAMTWK